MLPLATPMTLQFLNMGPPESPLLIPALSKALLLYVTMFRSTSAIRLNPNRLGLFPSCRLTSLYPITATGSPIAAGLVSIRNIDLNEPFGNTTYP